MPLTLRLLPPKSYRLRNRPPEWEVSDEAGHVVGWIEQHHIGGASQAFYMLRGVHPDTGETIPLELSADFDERLMKLERFLADPDSYAQHYPSGSRASRVVETRLGAPAWQLRGGREGRHG